MRNKVVGVCVLVFASAAHAAPTVLEGPVYYGGHTYYLLSQSNWTDAEAAAVLMGGHLAAINTLAENDFLFTAFAAQHRNLMIGLTDAAVEGTFVWTNGDPLTYTNWGPTQPSNTGPVGNEDYATLGFDDPAFGENFTGLGAWNDIDNLTTNGLLDGAPVKNYGLVEVVPLPAAVWGGLLGLGALAAMQLRARSRSRDVARA